MDNSKDSTLSSSMKNIETVVFLMLENRSLDNVLGLLYSEDNPLHVYPTTSESKFNGVPLTAKNYHKPPFVDKNAYSPTNGSSSMHSPSFDPGEKFEHVQNQIYADADLSGEGKLPSGEFWSKTPTMTGFAWDYDTVLTTTQQVMGCYNQSNLPVLYGLAEQYAVSDRWFCSVPTQTYANRAFSICGTSLGAVDNADITKDTFANTKTIFNVLSDAGKSWGLYWVDDGGLAAGSPKGDPYTPYYFSKLKSATNGGIYEFDKQGENQAFMQSVSAGNLPNFCFVEPAWGGGYSYDLSIQGTDFHPPTSVKNGDEALRTLFDALVASPQWGNMLLIITFDEHGGTYDHVPPPLTVAPDDSTPIMHTNAAGFAFQRLGVRVPTLLVSPYIPKGLVFRSDVDGADFDHTSFLATLCKWAGVEPENAGLGARVAQAPTFEKVFSDSARTDKPTFPAGSTTDENVQVTNPLSSPAPLGADGQPRIAEPLHFGDFHSIIDASNSREDFVERLKQARYPKDK